MLTHSPYFRIHSLQTRTKHTRQPDLPRIPLQRSIHKRVRHTLHITLRFRVGESLIGGGEVEAVCVRDGSLSCGGGGVSEEAEDGVEDLGGVVELEAGLDGGEELLVGVFCLRWVS